MDGNSEREMNTDDNLNHNDGGKYLYSNWDNNDNIDIDDDCKNIEEMTRYNTLTNGQSIVVRQTEKEKQEKEEEEENTKKQRRIIKSDDTTRTSITSTKENLNASMTEYKTWYTCINWCNKWNNW